MSSKQMKRTIFFAFSSIRLNELLVVGKNLLASLEEKNKNIYLN